MAELQEFEVKLSNGQRGTVLRSSRFLDKREFNTVKLSNGTELKVPSANLEPQQDGSFYLRDGQSQSSPKPESATEAPADRRSTIDAALFKEDIDMQRVAVNRIIDAPVDVRIEDGVTIIPVMEERLKIEKQLILREEIRIIKKRTTVRDERLASLSRDSKDVSSQGERER